MQSIGTVVALYRYPVKSLRAEVLTTATVGSGGFDGDRGTALIVQSREHARTGKTYRGKENRRLHTVSTVDDAHDLALSTGITVAAEDDDDHYFDLEPVSIVFDTWIRDLETLAQRPVDPLQFRPNIVASAASTFVAREADLIGMRMTIGDVTLDVVAPITRCVTITYDIATGDADPALGRTIVRDRDNMMGLYARVAVPGTITTGAPIQLSGTVRGA